MFGMQKKELPDVVRSGNPYLNAQEIWFEQYGRYITSAARWRIFAFVMMIITLISVTANVIQVRQDKIVRYFVAMDDLGHAVAEKINAAGGTTPERMIQAEVAQFIVNWRSVTVDRGLQQKMIAGVSAHVGGAAKGILAQWYEKDSPYQVAEDGKLVNVEIKSVPLKMSKNSYRVEWTEIIRSLSGEELGRVSYEAIVTVELYPPQTEEMILKNPGGVFVVNLSVARLLKQQ